MVSCCSVVLVAGLLTAFAEAGNFTLYSEEVRLRPGEVHNKFIKPIIVPYDIIARFHGRNLSISAFDVDILTRDSTTGAERSVPLTSVYNHHNVVVGGGGRLNEFYESFAQNETQVHGCGAHGMKRVVEAHAKGKGLVVFGGGTGGEFRHFDFTLAEPYAVQVFSPTHFMLLPHWININGDSSLLECPCASWRDINVTDGTIDGEKVEKFECHSELLAQKNPSCSLATYKGGLRCCRDGAFLTEHPDRSAPYLSVFAKLVFQYRDDAETARQHPVAAHLARCCDVTGDRFHHGSLGPGAGGGNAEYDVPQCAPGTPPEACIHVVTNVQTLDYEDTAKYDADEVLEIVSAVGHMHVAGLSIDLFDDRTGELLCHSAPRYGSGTATSVGNEAGMLVQMFGCKWGPSPLQAPPRFRAADLVRTVSYYNSTKSHTGVMGLWLIQVAPVAGKSAGIKTEFVI